MKWLDSITYLMDMKFSKLCEIVEDRVAWCSVVQGSQRVEHNLETKQPQHLYIYKIIRYTYKYPDAGKDRSRRRRE